MQICPKTPFSSINNIFFWKVDIGFEWWKCGMLVVVCKSTSALQFNSIYPLAFPQMLIWVTENWITLENSVPFREIGDKIIQSTFTQFPPTPSDLGNTANRNARFIAYEQSQCIFLALPLLVPAIALLWGRPRYGNPAEEDVRRLGEAPTTLLDHPGTAIFSWWQN